MNILSILGTYKDNQLETLALYTTRGNKMYKRASYQSEESFMEFAIQHFRANISSQFSKVLVHGKRDKGIANKIVDRLQRFIKVEIVYPKQIQLDGKPKSLNIAFKELYPNSDGVVSGYATMNNAYKLYKVYQHLNHFEKAGA